MPLQHKYTVAATVTQDTVRVRTIVIMPHALNADASKGRVELNYEIGEEVGSDFNVNESASIQIAYSALPAPTVTTLGNLESQALTYGANNGVYSAGSEEAVP